MKNKSIVITISLSITCMLLSCQALKFHSSNGRASSILERSGSNSWKILANQLILLQMAQSQDETYAVKDGDTLSSIARQFYGSGNETSWRKIYDANKDLIGNNPNIIQTGQNLTIPSQETSPNNSTANSSISPSPEPVPPSLPNNSNETYTIKEGDTLSSIALQFYGNGDETNWRKIFEANKDLIGNDPNTIPVGQNITIPTIEDPNEPLSTSNSTNVLNFSQVIIAVEAIKASYEGFISIIPPRFCWKTNGDAGEIPECPEGYWKSGALCYEICRDGYHFVAGGTCWERDCRSGYTDAGALCTDWSTLDTYTKDSYPTSTLTMFEGRCNEGAYLSGALCYRDCGRVGMVNCGIGACALSSKACAEEIGSIIIDFIFGAVEAVQFVLTAGASASDIDSQQIIKNEFDGADVNIISEAFIDAKSFQSNKGRDYMIQTAIDNAVQEHGIRLGIKLIEEVCRNISGRIYDENLVREEVKLEFKDLDPTNIASAVETCKDTSTEDRQISCAKEVLNAVDFIDPTGLTAMAAAFVESDCKNI